MRKGVCEREPSSHIPAQPSNAGLLPPVLTYETDTMPADLPNGTVVRLQSEHRDEMKTIAGT